MIIFPALSLVDHVGNSPSNPGGVGGLGWGSSFRVAVDISSQGHNLAPVWTGSAVSS